MSQVVLFGITGFAGGHIARELVERGFVVTGVSRTEPPQRDDRIGYASGSLHDTAFVEGLVKHADIVVLAVRATSIAETASFAETVAALLPIVERAGARLAVVGGAGSLRLPGQQLKNMEREDFREEWLPEAREHIAALEVLKTRAPDSLEWFYLSPPALFGSYAAGTATGQYRTGAEELVVDAAGKSYISGEDYALAFVDEIEHPRHSRSRFTVGY